MKQQITVTLNGLPMQAVRGMTLSEIIKNEAPCGGHGKCGKCKVIAVGTLSPITDSERAHLSPEELQRGVRLACITKAMGDCEVCTSLEGDHVKKQIVTDCDLPTFSLDPAFSRYGVAIDIGTTTLAARLYDANGTLLSTESRLNPQASFGADVISRIEAELGGKGKELASSIRGALNEMILSLAKDCGVSAAEIDGAVITGNTVMLYLLTETSTEPLSHAPFHADRVFGECLTAQALEISCLSPETEIYLPPCISAFVGADITCAILSTELTKKNEPTMLVDIGTNGEIALWNGKALTVCSTAAGPAFEGVGISMGMNAREGAIDKVRFADGQLSAHVIGNRTPIGVCGSGLVDAIACLLECEELDPSGYLEYGEVTLATPVLLTQKDIRMVQLAKSAICAGLMTLLKTEQVALADVSALCVAGGFGRYLNMENAGRIGLLPPELIDRTKTVGNAALSGAVMLLLDRRMRDGEQMLVKKGRAVELSTNPIFIDAYTEGMLFEE